MVFNLEQNKESAQAFFQLAFDGNPQQAVEMYVGEMYIQHNPLVGDSPKAFIEYFTKMEREFPDKSIEFLRVIAEENLLALHTRQIWPDQLEYVTMDFFRFNKEGKIIEH